MKRPTQHVSFTQETFDRLTAYLQAKYGTQRAMSLTVNQAVKEFLERNNHDVAPVLKSTERG